MTIEYEPMDPPKRVSLERMQEILAKHTKRASELKQLNEEIWLAKKLKAYDDTFKGLTTIALRMQRLRAEIGPVAKTVCGVRRGVATTYAQVFEIVYGEPL